MPIFRNSPTPLPTPEGEHWRTIGAALGELKPTSAARNKAIEAMHALAESERRRIKIIGLVQEALGQLRLDMKYLIFDLQVTRDERDALREKYEK